MHVDTSIWPTTLDAGHLLLAALVMVLLISQVLLLTLGVFSLLRRGREPARAAELPAVAASERSAEPSSPPASARMTGFHDAAPESALQLLGLLQSEARFIDFVQETVTGFTDAEIGAAARVVHEGCRKVVHQHFVLEPIRQEPENSRLSVPKGFDAGSIRLTGNIVGQAPFSGTLVHRGWRVREVKLPRLAEGHDSRVIAPAEVEL